MVARIAQADVARNRVEAAAVLAETRPEHRALVSICGKARSSVRQDLRLRTPKPDLLGWNPGPDNCQLGDSGQLAYVLLASVFYLKNVVLQL